MHVDGGRKAAKTWRDPILASSRGQKDFFSPFLPPGAFQEVRVGGGGRFKQLISILNFRHGIRQQEKKRFFTLALLPFSWNVIKVALRL